MDMTLPDRKIWLITGWSGKFDGICVVSPGETLEEAIQNCEYLAGCRLVHFQGIIDEEEEELFDGMYLFPGHTKKKSLEELLQGIKEDHQSNSIARWYWEIFATPLEMGNNPDVVCW